jgi:prophage regulatory protein
MASRWRRRLEQLLRIDRVAALTGLSRTTIDRLERAGRFPRRRRIATREVAWTVSEIEDWLANQSVVEIKPKCYPPEQLSTDVVRAGHN